jgi:hypothetical protein
MFFGNIKGVFMNKGGRPPLQFTDAQRKLVSKMSGFGVPFANIAALVTEDGIDEDTLNKHFKKELAQGKAKTNSKIGQTLYNKAIEGDTSALIWWSKTQMRWREDKSEAQVIEEAITKIARVIVGKDDELKA